MARIGKARTRSEPKARREGNRPFCQLLSALVWRASMKLITTVSSPEETVITRSAGNWACSANRAISMLRAYTSAASGIGSFVSGGDVGRVVQPRAQWSSQRSWSEGVGINGVFRLSEATRD